MRLVGIHLGKVLPVVGGILAVCRLDLAEVGIIVEINLGLRQVPADRLAGQVCPQRVCLGVRHLVGNLGLQLLADIGDVLLQVLRIAGIHVLLGGVLQRLLHKLPVELRQGVLNGILHHHVKRSLLTVQLLLAIILREGRLDRDRAFLGGQRGNDIDQPVLKAGDEGSGAELQLIGSLIVPVGTAGELLAVNLALVVDEGGVALLHLLVGHLLGAVIGNAVLKQYGLLDILHRVLIGHAQTGRQCQLHVGVVRRLNIDI